MSFGARVKALRLKNDLTQMQLAEKINLSKANVSKYEAGLVEPNLQTLKLLSLFFDVSIDYLITGREKSSIDRIDGDKEALWNKYSVLDDEDRETVNALIDSLLNKDKYNKKPDKNVG